MATFGGGKTKKKVRTRRAGGRCGLAWRPRRGAAQTCAMPKAAPSCTARTAARCCTALHRLEGQMAKLHGELCGEPYGEVEVDVTKGS